MRASITSGALRGVCATLLAVGSIGCSGSDDATAGGDAPGDTLDVQCAGKCDGWGSIESYYRDAKNLDLGDLVAVGAGFASEGLNDTLTVSDFAGIQIAEPKFYTTQEQAAQDVTLEDLNKLVSGLATTFGERELTTEVNELRLAHLQSSSNKLYAELAFQVGAGVHGWNIATGGFGGGSVNVGFDANASLGVRVIGAYADELAAVKGAPLKALRAARGFVLPRSLDDVRALQPGEVLAWSGQGNIGLNVGVGVPLLVASPTPALSYGIVLSAALRTRLGGDVDVQLVRLSGDQIVVDVGVQVGSILSAELGLSDGWGVLGLVKKSASVGGANVDLGKLADKSLRKQLDDKLNFVAARLAKTKQKTRLNVARMRFSLDAGADPARLEQAVAQALRGDVRLAQAMANAGDPGVTAEFDISRSGVSATSTAGVEIFGMHFFKSVTEGAGSVVVQTPGGARTLLFDSLHKEGGWFFSSHGYTRVGVSGLVYDAQNAGALPTGEANLFVQLQEGDEFMERDKLLDHLDSVIRALGGKDALSAIEGPGNELEAYVQKTCNPSPAFDPCRTEVLSDPTVVSLRQQGEQALAQAVAGLEPGVRDLVTKCGALRLATQATVEPAASFVGPNASVVLDYRMDDRAVTSLLVDKNRFDVKNALLGHLEAVTIDRQDPATTIQADRAKLDSGKTKETLDALMTIYDDASSRYVRLVAAEEAVISSIGPIGPRAVELRFPVDAQKRVDYDKATASSFSQARSKVAMELFDKLVGASSPLGRNDEQPVGYALLSLVPSDHVDLRVDVDMDLGNGFSQNFDHYKQAGWAPLDAYAKGSQVAPIDGGQFSVDALLNLK